MQRKYLIALSALVASLVLREAQAIGLADISLRTGLNQPLRADIPLLQAKNLDESQIEVSLAPLEDFKNAKIDYNFILNSLRFKVDLSNPKNPKVWVTTTQPITEPYLNFLLQIQWPNGRLLREYTLLLDVPANTAKQRIQPLAAGQAVPRDHSLTTTRRSGTLTPSVLPMRGKPLMNQETLAYRSPSRSGVRVRRATAAEISATVQAQHNRPSAEQTTPNAESDATAEQTATAPVYGPTRRRDTLWLIAQRMRRHGSLQQNMLAIQQLNPHAFVDNNINRLKKGEHLRLPTPADIKLINPADAIAATETQYAQWKNKTSTQAPEPPSQLVAATASENAAAVDDKLRLTTLSKTDASHADPIAGERAALEARLTSDTEEVGRMTREQQDRLSRRDDLDAQISNAERLITLQSSELAALQLKMAEEQAANAVSTAASTDKPAAPNAKFPTTQPTTPPAPAANTAAPPPPNQKKLTPTVDKKPPAVAPAAAEEPLFNTPMLAGIAALFAALLAWFAYRFVANKREEEEYDYEYELDEDEDEDETLGDETAFETSPVHSNVRKETLPTAVVPEADAEPETGDVLGEADIYISFGGFDKGANLLKTAIKNEPSRSDYRVKLLELYKETSNLSAFDDAYQDLLLLNEPAANQRAEELRSKIQGAAEKRIVPANINSNAPTINKDSVQPILSTAATPSTPIAAAANKPTFDFDLDIDPPANSSAAVDNTAPAASPAFDFSLDTEHAFDAPTKKPEAPPAAAAKLDNNILDFATLDDIDLEAMTTDHEELSFDTIPDFGSAITEKPSSTIHAADNMLMLADADADDEELGFLSGTDEAATKLDLARAYIDMGDKNGAKDILEEVLEEGRDEQKHEAKTLLASMA